jgi:hypothetical protein
MIHAFDPRLDALARLLSHEGFTAIGVEVMRALMVAVCVGVGLLGWGLAPGYGAETKQQELMKTCNADASAKKLTGDARKTFMSQCLSGNKVATGNTQQQKMKACNEQANAKKITGDARKSFMSTCLKG